MKKQQPKQELWYAAGGGIARCGPFKSQRDAYLSMRLTEDARQKSEKPECPYPVDVLVWPEFSETESV